MAIERLIVGKNEYFFDHTFLEHIARYKFACKESKNKIVLDAACGSGYGSMLLAKQAAVVAGVDVSTEAIRFCRAQYRRTRLFFARMDAQKIAFKNGCFDIVVSFETIEHLPHQRKFIAEMSRILKNRGQLIISTPVKGIYPSEADSNNAYHLHELEPEEFISMLKEKFEITALYGQIFKPESKASQEKITRQCQIHKIIFMTKQLIKKYFFRNSWVFPFFLRFSTLGKDSQVVSYNPVKKYQYLIAICRNG